MGKVYKEIIVKIPAENNIICNRTKGHRVEKVINLQLLLAMGKRQKKNFNWICCKPNNDVS